MHVSHPIYQSMFGNAKHVLLDKILIVHALMPFMSTSTLIASWSMMLNSLDLIHLWYQ